MSDKQPKNMKQIGIACALIALLIVSLAVVYSFYSQPVLNVGGNPGATGATGPQGIQGSNGTSGLAAWTLPYSNITNIPSIGDYSYIISANDPVIGNYSARLPNGTMLWSSANQTSVLASVTSGASVGSSIYASAGVFGSKVCHLIVGNGTQSLTAGQVAYQSSQGFYSVASASANSTIGYGYVWLIAINSNANANCLLMNDGVFTLNSWSLTSGLAWVSTTGTVTSTYPSATGNQLVSIGSMLNATTLQVQNPNGNYGEHV
jgi:hypothetical protein